MKKVIFTVTLLVMMTIVAGSGLAASAVKQEYQLISEMNTALMEETALSAELDQEYARLVELNTAYMRETALQSDLEQKSQRLTELLEMNRKSNP